MRRIAATICSALACLLLLGGPAAGAATAATPTEVVASDNTPWG
ncbi:MAG: hypothetical protein AVDCRST_MAG66-4418 [uncultured Pseudonocardia sp.]|uniref:Uncharacterized protein n=1 Tax=uncultured Pseudonocardia sp. TaxID=211455 RepID=A0A6J4QFX3_9PSEU|nr:MAG: hypothetical protein AVDCRST_MAG66-4418 [uncultured Pseudonocardia sp.]